MTKVFVSTAALLMTAGATTAFAADDDNDGYDDMTGEPVSTEETTTTTEDTSTSTTTTSTTTTAAGSSNPYTMGISVPLIGSDFLSFVELLDPTDGPIATPIPTANLLWALGDNWLDLGLGLRVTSGPDPAMPMDNKTTVGMLFDVGYRMMKPTKGRVMPFLKPFVQLGIGDFGAAGDTLILGAGATLGVDVMIVEQFTLGAEIGGGLATSDGFDTFRLGTTTSTLNATIWW